MDIKRFYIENDGINGDNVLIIGDEAVHIANVLRYKVGYKIIVNNNIDGIDYHCKITAIDKQCVAATVVDRLVNRVMSSRKITLLMALPKGDKPDTIVQKAIELGIHSVVFFRSSFVSETKYNSQRLTKIAKEAAKQCGAAIYPIIGELMEYRDVISRYFDECLTLFFYENEKNNYIDNALIARINSQTSINIVVGSEGGFSEDEWIYAKDCGAISISLGARIMRCETAAMAVMAITQYIGGGFMYV